MLTRVAGRLDNNRATLALRGACVMVVQVSGLELGALALTRALSNAVRWLDAAAGFTTDRVRWAADTWSDVCSAVLKLLCHFTTESTTEFPAPHSLARWNATYVLVSILAAPRWVPLTPRAREQGGHLTLWRSLLDTAQNFAADDVAHPDSADHIAICKTLRYLGRVFRVTTATSVMVLPAAPMTDVIRKNAEWTNLRASMVLAEMSGAYRDRRLFIKWLLLYWLMPDSYRAPAEQRALRCGNTPSPMRHCKCARCVPGRADCPASNRRTSDLQLFAQVTATFARIYPDYRALAARAIAYLLQNRIVPAGNVELAEDRDQLIMNVQCMRIQSSLWAGAAGERRRDAALAAVIRARNRRTALAAFKLSPPIRDDCDEADLLADLDRTGTAARVDAGGWPMSDDEDENTALVPHLLDRALCALTGDGGADGRPAKDAAAAAAAAAEAAAAALLAEEEAASVAQASSAAGKKKRPGSSARKRAAAAGAADAALEPAAPAQAPPAPPVACAAEVQTPAAPTELPAAAAVPEPGAAIEELFPWLALGDATPAEQDAAHEDDGLCIICLDAERSTPLPGCADAHAPVLCATCAAAMCARAAQQAVCPWCSAPCACAAAP